MKKGNLYQILLINCLLILSFASCKKDRTQAENRRDILPFYTEATFTPQWLNPAQDTIKSLHTVPAFSLTNQLGETVTQETFQDKIYVTDFFFTFCTTICPKMTANMKRVQDAFKNDDEILLLSHSVTPEHDTPQILKDYGEAYGAIDKKWHLVTGDKSEIYDLGRNGYFVEENIGLQKAPDDFLHTENFILVDKNKHIRGIYNGTVDASIQNLIDDIKLLKKE